MPTLVPASDTQQWRALLARVGEVDATFLPEYHAAYALRVPGAVPWLWHFEQAGAHLVYPFLLTPVLVDGSATGHHDISSVYGFTGPLASTADPGFLQAAWTAFDAWAASQRIVAEFIRFSPFNRNEGLAHPEAMVSANRTLAASSLAGSQEQLLAALGPKTRNMIRKAQREGLVARELPLPELLPAFRALYAETMKRNAAPEFFWYDDAYWSHLLQLGSGLRLFGALHGDTLVGASMSVSHGASGLYHLGASLPEYARLGAGNLSLFAMSDGLRESGVRFLNMTGGRTTRPDDPLLLFKRSNATGTAPFHIGKRVVDPAAYNEVATLWRQLHGAAPDAEKIIFWRP